MRIVKKMASAATIAVFLLCCYFIVSSGSQADCNVYAATGSNFTVQLKHVLKDSDSLRWFKNKKVIFLRKSKLVIRGKNDDVDSNGKLKLTQLTKDKSGRYRPEVHREDGTSAVDLPSVRLCVLDPVQKPKVTVTCDKTKVTFTCDAGQNFPIKWFMDNKNGPENETGKELKRPVKDVLNARFSCNVSNPVSSEISQPVQQDCIKSSFPETLFGVIKISADCQCFFHASSVVLILDNICLSDTTLRESSQCHNNTGLPDQFIESFCICNPQPAAPAGNSIEDCLMGQQVEGCKCKMTQ
uniref:Ig-like domain-containing protein n=1 Tax=Oreochromis aureus TaxID=47969 RepID=A0A668TMB5_OREAU